MAKLAVVDAGGEEEEERCCTPEMAEFIEAMFQELPAHSHAEIAEAINVTEAKVDDLLSHLRANAISHGWTVPHARRGKTTDELRFYAVLVDSAGEPYADHDGRLAVAGGLEGTLAIIETMSANEFTALDLFKAYLPHGLQRRRLTRIMRALRNVNEETRDAREEGLGWANGDV